MGRRELIQNCLELINTLELHKLDQEWINQTSDNEFTEKFELPLHYQDDVLEDIDINKVFSRLTQYAKDYLRCEDEVEAAGSPEESIALSLNQKSFWSQLSDQGVKNASLIALISYYVHSGLELSSSTNNIITSLISSGLYFCLVGLPGSGPYKIFHPILYAKSLDTLGMAKKLPMLQYTSKRKHSQASSQQRKRQKGSSQQSQRNSQAVDEGEEDSTDLSEEDQEEISNLLIKSIQCLRDLLKFSSLKGSMESITPTVEAIIPILRLETSTVLEQIDGGRHQRFPVENLAFSAIRCLQSIASSAHGDLSTCIGFVFKELVSLILMIPEESSQVTSAGLTVIKKNCLGLVNQIIKANSAPDCSDRRSVSGSSGSDRRSVAGPSVSGGSAASSKEVMSNSVLVFIEHLAARTPDKTEYRRESSMTIVNLLDLLETKHYDMGIRWLMKYAFISKTSSRVMAVEILGCLLTAAVHTGNESENSVGKQEVLKKYSAAMFAIVYEKTNDSANTVTTQALKVLGEITSCENESIKLLLQQAQNNTSENEVDWIELLENPVEENIDDQIKEIKPLPPWPVFIHQIQAKVLDISVFVRKSALTVIENILRTSGNITGDMLNILVKHCADLSVAIRKQMAGVLTDLVLEHPTNFRLVAAWVKGVLPMVKDVESKVSEKACECIYNVILKNLVPDPRAETDHHQLPWLVLTSIERLKMVLYLSQAVSHWAKEKMITKNHITSLLSYIETEKVTEAWLFLGVLTTYVPCTDPHFVLQQFNKALKEPQCNIAPTQRPSSSSQSQISNASVYSQSQETDISHSQSETASRLSNHTPQENLDTLLNISKVLLASVSNLEEEDQDTLKEILLLKLEQFKLPVEIIATALDICTVIIRKRNESLKAYNSALEGWTVGVINKIEDFLSKQILGVPSHKRSDRSISRYVFTLGEIAQLSYTRLSKKLFMLMQSIVFFKDEGSAMEDHQTVFSQEVQCRFVPSSQLRAVAVGTLGKMCLQNEDNAKKIIPAFGQILDKTSDAAMKTNIMYVLSDMCVRYASLVDPLIPQMAACLKDESLMVRRTTLVQLVHLLQEDYLKIRGKSKFFLYFLQTLLDQSREIQTLSEFFMEQRLLKRIPNIMYSSFIEAVFHYNSFKGHERYNKFEQTEKEKSCFSLSGSQNRDNRFRLFRYMLLHMTDEEKFRTVFYLNQDILQAVSDKKIQLESATELLKDAFRCLLSDEIKLSCLKKQPATAEDADMAGSQDQAAANPEAHIREALTRAVFNKQWTKNVVEIIIPIIIELKATLEAKRSPFLKDLFDYLKKLMEDYKEQVSEILSADPQLAKEIQYELKKFDEQEEKRKEEERLAAEREALRFVPGSRRSMSNPSSRPTTPRPGTSNPSSRPTTPRSGSPAPGTSAGQRPAGTPSTGPRATGTPSSGQRAAPVTLETPGGTLIRSDSTPARLLQKKSKERILQQMMMSNTPQQTPRRNSLNKSGNNVSMENRPENTSTNRTVSGDVEMNGVDAGNDSNTDDDSNDLYSTNAGNGTKTGNSNVTNVVNSTSDVTVNGDEDPAASNKDSSAPVEMEVEQGEESLENEQEKENVDISRLSIQDQETNQTNGDSNTSTDHTKDNNKRKQKKDKNRDGTKDHTVIDTAEERNIEDVTNKQRQSRSSSIRESADNSANKSKSADRSKSADNSDKSIDKKRKGSLSSSRISSKRSKSSVGSLHPIPEGEVTHTRTVSVGEVRVSGANGVTNPTNDDEVFRTPAPALNKPGRTSGQMRAQGTGDQRKSVQDQQELDQSRRISGQGMERPQMKTPRTRKVNQYRAVSTPQVNQTLMAQDASFINESLELSSITVLSPPSTIGGSSKQKLSTSTDSTFRLEKDSFDAVVNSGKESRGTSSTTATSGTLQKTSSTASSAPSGPINRSVNSSLNQTGRQHRFRLSK